mgnify:CR=1 FL=1
MMRDFSWILRGVAVGLIGWQAGGLGVLLVLVVELGGLLAGVGVAGVVGGDGQGRGEEGVVDRVVVRVMTRREMVCHS